MLEVGGIPLPIFSEWWLAKEKFSVIDSFVLSSFPGANVQGCNGLSVKYQLESMLPCLTGEDGELISSYHIEVGQVYEFLSFFLSLSCKELAEGGTETYVAPTIA
ncbi:unnamed protein product [Ilex paraguariensis]|uniref:Uncharacterized protein n=1 Tax=Ilex paraguariensis TaxID=185542 RepID=A0ABC8USH5_9AQUA